MVSCEPQSVHTAILTTFDLLPNNQPEPVTNVGLTTINVSIVLILRAWHISVSRAEPNTINLLAWRVMSRIANKGLVVPLISF